MGLKEFTSVFQRHLDQEEIPIRELVMPPKGEPLNKVIIDMCRALTTYTLALDGFACDVYRSVKQGPTTKSASNGVE